MLLGAEGIEASFKVCDFILFLQIPSPEIVGRSATPNDKVGDLSDLLVCLVCLINGRGKFPTELDNCGVLQLDSADASRDIQMFSSCDI